MGTLPRKHSTRALLGAIWNHALPSLVTRIDGYAALPEEAVSFVRPEHERADIQEGLRGFLAQPDLYRHKGARSREILLEQHRPATYVDRLAGLCEHLATLRSRHVRLEAAGRAGQRIAPWSHLAPRSEAERRCAEAIAELF